MIKYKLILLRHGESKWNLENKFTGWTNVDLTKKGINEAKNAGKLLLKEKFEVNQVYTSLLLRANNTMNICLDTLKANINEIKFDWRLNERHYGTLQGLNKSEIANRYGDKQVLKWRRSYDIPPPKLKLDDKRHPIHDKIYKNIDSSMLPSSESLKDTLDRFKPLWEDDIIPSIRSGEKVMIVAHGNSLRALVKILDKISNKDIVNLNIPTGVPLIYELDSEMMPLTSYYLGDQDEIKRKIASIKNQGKSKTLN